MLSPYVPDAALDYCSSLHSKFQFRLIIKNKRLTKLGDYKFDPRTGTHSISINNDLNPYSFLITYIHEVAHHATMLKFGRKVKPHGPEWKNEFKLLMLPILNHSVFPDELLRKIAAYLKNPKASSCNDHTLTKALSVYDNRNGQVFLSEIAHESRFQLGKRAFKKRELRRTRFLCEEIKTGKKYLISKSALVNAI